MALPFAVPAEPHGHEAEAGKCPLHGMLPEALRERAEAAPHLMQYLHMVPFAEVGVPEYHPKLTRKLGDIANPNLIYPVGDDIFVHIYPDPQDARNYYIAVEPVLIENLTKILSKLERRLLDYVDALTAAETIEEKAKVLIRAVEEHTRIVKHKVSLLAKAAVPNGRRLLGLLGPRNTSDDKIPVTKQEFEALKYLLVRDKIRMGVLDPMIVDPYIEDISCSGLGPLFIEHKIFKGLKASISFTETELLDEFVLRLSEKVGKPVTFRNPIVDASLPDGSRINIVYGGDVSKRGSNFTIRKFASTPMSAIDLIESGGMDYSIAAYLSLMVGEGCNLFVSGETASGKTTLLNAINAFIPSYAKVVTIEDTPELQVPHPNWTQEVVRGAMADENSTVTMFGLLKAALRQRPNAILIGEIRGEEGAIAFQAMQTGHAVMATFHASSVQKLIQRMTGNPINVPKTYIDNLNVVVLCSAVRLPNGKMGRRITSINEIIGYDSSSDAFSFVEVFHWNSHTDVFEFTGNMNSYLLENRIAPKRGLSTKDKRLIYQELERRANLLKKLRETGVSEFHDLYKVLARAQREGLF